MSLYRQAAQAQWTVPFLLAKPESGILDWDCIDSQLECISALRDCPQDPRWHAEGDVHIHTQMVCTALTSLEDWRTLPPVERSIVLAAALFHDIGKPHCTQTQDDGTITSKGHARHGTQIVRGLMYREDMAPLSVREAICATVRHHGLPLLFMEKTSPQRAVIEASQTVSCQWLALVAKADVLGRECVDKNELLERIALFEDFCAENRCLTAPRTFASDHSRFVYFQKEDASPEYAAYDDCKFDVVLISGLPAAGKDHWIRENLPGFELISLDLLRTEMNIRPEDEQGPVVARAKELAREHARAARSFVWNATNISRQMRSQLIRLVAGYKARIRIVYLETPYQELLRRNTQRPTKVPSGVIERLIDKLEIPDPTEAHTVSWHLTAIMG